MVWVTEQREDGVKLFRPARNMEEVISGLKGKHGYPADITGELVPAADMTFRWMRWEGADPGIHFEVPDYLEKEPYLMCSMMRNVLDYIVGYEENLHYDRDVKEMLMDENFVLEHQPTCLGRMSVRCAAGDTYDLDEIYRDLVRNGDLEPDKLVAFGWDESAGDDRDTPYGMSKTFHVVTIPAFMDDPDVPRSAIGYAIWCAVRRLNAGPFWEPDPIPAPRRLRSGAAWLYDLAAALNEDEE